MAVHAAFDIEMQDLAHRAEEAINEKPKLKTKFVTKADDVCSICREDITASKPGYEINCHHRNHIPCLINWFDVELRSRIFVRCPNCKVELFYEKHLKDKVLYNFNVPKCVKISSIIGGVVFGVTVASLGCYYFGPNIL